MSCPYSSVDNDIISNCRLCIYCVFLKFSYRYYIVMVEGLNLSNALYILRKIVCRGKVLPFICSIYLLWRQLNGRLFFSSI